MWYGLPRADLLVHLRAGEVGDVEFVVPLGKIESDDEKRKRQPLPPSPVNEQVNDHILGRLQPRCASHEFESTYLSEAIAVRERNLHRTLDV